MHVRVTAPEGVSLRLRLQARPESAYLLRERLRLWLDELGAEASETFDISIASTEAFANALEHPCDPTDSTIDVHATALAGSIAVTVRDRGTWRAERRRQEGGFGLDLMRSLMDAIEIDAQPQGTSITLRRQLAQAACP
jgi:anti-sigma regulatory factor (Ser/Thr protein kinase)